jgi:hypothetical protein
MVEVLSKVALRREREEAKVQKQNKNPFLG